MPARTTLSRNGRTPQPGKGTRLPDDNLDEVLKTLLHIRIRDCWLNYRHLWGHSAFSGLDKLGKGHIPYGGPTSAQQYFCHYVLCPSAVVSFNQGSILMIFYQPSCSLCICIFCKIKFWPVRQAVMDYFGVKHFMFESVLQFTKAVRSARYSQSKSPCRRHSESVLMKPRCRHRTYRRWTERVATTILRSVPENSTFWKILLLCWIL